MNDAFGGRILEKSIARKALDGSVFLPLLAVTLCVAASADGSELDIREHLQGSAKFETDGAFSALVMLKPEIGLPKGNGSDRLVMNSGNGYRNGFRLCLVADGVSGGYHPLLRIGMPDSAYELSAPLGSVAAGHWHRVAATWDGRVARLYVNGREVASGIHASPYVPAQEKMAWVGTPKKAWVGMPSLYFGMLSLPCLVERAAVYPIALSEGAVADWAADATPFEPDTPEFSAALARVEGGTKVSSAELDAFRSSPHSPLALLALDRAKAFALVNERRFAEADRLADGVEARLKQLPDGSLLIVAFKAMMHDLRMSCGTADRLIDDCRRDYAKACADNVGHLPYVALALMKALDKAGRAEEAARVRDEIKRMDLRRFPHLAEELGLKGEYTAHHEKGASVPRDMPKTAFYVSPEGDDTSNGSAEHPFKTLVRAREAVRALKAKGLPPGGVAVRLRGGVYRVKETFELSGESDSGSPDRPVVWCADGDDLPVFDGGFDVPPLNPVNDPDMLKRIPVVAHGRVWCCDVRAAGYKHTTRPGQYGRHREAVVPVTDLLQNGKLLTLARHPDHGWLKVEEFGQQGDTWLKPVLDDFRSWAAEPDLMATGFWIALWADYTTTVTNVDVEKGALAVNLPGWIHPKKGHPFFLLNALCALDAPGEWYLDSRSGILYVWPRGDESCAKFTLTSFNGPFLKVSGVHDVRVEGIEFQNGRGTGIEFSDCREVVFAGNVVRNFGGNGMNAHRMANTTIRDNVFRSFGHGALEVSGGDRRTLVHSGNVISNNDFSDIGNRRRTYAPHLHLAGVGVEVSFNYFGKSPSSAMRLEGNDFLIVSNLVEDVLLESDDQGGVDIYFNASYFGNRYCYNTWKNIGRQTDKVPCGQAAIRFDGNISGQTVVGNRFINCGTGGFGAIQSCGGRLHMIDNNLFVNCNKIMSISNYETNFWFNTIRPTLVKPCLVDVCITNEPFSTRYPGIADLLWTNQVNHLVRNVTVGTPLLVYSPTATIAYGNYHFAEMPDLGALARDTAWQPIPDESETGPRLTPMFVRAKQADTAD